MLFHIWNPLLEWQVRHCINFYFPSHFNMLFHPTQLLIILIYYTTSISHDFLIEFYFLIRSPPYKVITLFGFMNIMVSTGIFLPLELFFSFHKNLLFYLLKSVTVSLPYLPSIFSYPNTMWHPWYCYYNPPFLE